MGWPITPPVELLVSAPVSRCGELAECRLGDSASSRYAAPTLRYGPSGDPLSPKRRSAAMAVSGAFGHGPIARRILRARAVGQSLRFLPWAVQERFRVES